MSEQPITKADYWPCACVKRDRQENLTHIKLNHPSVIRCPCCKADRPESLEEKDQP